MYKLRTVCSWLCVRAKWDSRNFLQLAQEHGACVLKKCRVEKIILRTEKAIGVKARKDGGPKFIKLISLFWLQAVLELCHTWNSGSNARRDYLSIRFLCRSCRMEKFFSEQKISMRSSSEKWLHSSLPISIISVSFSIKLEISCEWHSGNDDQDCWFEHRSRIKKSYW